MKKRAKLFIFAAFCFILAGIGNSISGNDATIFQKTYIRATQTPQVVTDTFLVAPGSSNFSLIVQNGKNGKHRVSSAAVSINGVQILGPYDFNQQVDLIEKPIALTDSNTISVKLDSAPGSFISLKITAEISNTSPVADAGSDQTVHLGSTITMDGSKSNDADGDPLTWRWSFQSMPQGSSASLSNSNSCYPSFVADKAGTYVVQLIVNDGKIDSAPSTVRISTENSRPVANAGSGQTVYVGTTVTLDGSRSSDVDGDVLTFSWSFASKPTESLAVISNATSVNPTFIIDVPGNYIIQLVANDGKVDSLPATVTVTTANSSPVASAGSDQTAFVGTPVVLDGSKSSDVDGDSLTFRWSFVALPAGSAAELSGPSEVMPAFFVDRPGTYVIQLIVNDGTVDSAPVTVNVTTANSRPVANGGSDQTAFVGTPVVLDGSKSGDVDGDSLTFRWSFVSLPAGSAAELSGPSEVMPAFFVDSPGTYVIQLIVNDGTVDSAPVTVNVTTLNSKPIADAGPDQSVIAGTTVTLDGSGSSDADNDYPTYHWSFTSIPEASLALLSDPSSVNPFFIADWAGMYVAQLMVNDGKVDGNPDTVVITAIEPIPVLTSITPNPATAGGQDFILQAIGSDFFPGFVVTFSGQNLTTTYINSGELNAAVPSSLITTTGAYPVSVLNSYGQSSNALYLTVENPVPELHSVNPATVPADTDAVIILAGSGFAANSGAALDANIIATAFINSNYLSLSIPGALLTPGNHAITVSNPSPGGGFSGAIMLSVTNPASQIPPDPGTAAPTLDTTVSTTMLASTQFLYTGDNPIQTGVSPGTIDVKRAGVIRGRVLNNDGSALVGVTISILNHPEFGSTKSRADGAFDMAVNGGGALTVLYDMPGYLPVQRQVNVPWQDYSWAPDVVMLPFDSNVSTIDLSSNSPIQVARGSVVTDNDGARQATLLFRQGTTAQMMLPDGSVQPLTKLSVRATEYTVGPNGPAAMPGDLPPNVAYTYAVEYSVDAALAAGAKIVQFSRPVISYTDNFLNFTIGMIVPSAYYDSDQGVWIPSDNGIVIKILGISNGVADLDIDGSNTPAGVQALSALGITDSELQQLGAMYQPGQSFWRVPVTHFTVWDYNLGEGPPADAGAPPPPPSSPPPSPPPPPSCGAGSCCFSAPGSGSGGSGPAGGDTQEGSIIGCQNQSLGETVNVTGTPFSLSYMSNRQPGTKADMTITIPLSGASVPASLKRIDLEIYIAGKKSFLSFPPASNLNYTFIWDGLDAYGRMTQGAQPATIRIGYVYNGVYLAPSVSASIAAAAKVFGHFSYYGIPASANLMRREVTLWQTYQNTLNMGHWNAQTQGLGGWTLSVQHAYDPVGKVLYLGDGNQWSVLNSNIKTITMVAGNGNAGYSGDGSLAVQASLNDPYGIAVDSSGNIYIADRGNNRIRKVDTSGIISTVAGNGNAGYSGDGSLAIQASLNGPYGIAIDNSGNIYIADRGNNRIRKVDTSGIITSVAGNGNAGYSGDGGRATLASLNQPTGVAVDRAGNIYIADKGNNRVRNIDSGGNITTVAGNGIAGYSGDVGRAAQATLNQPTGVAVDRFGKIYIADKGNNLIRRVDNSGFIDTIAGNGNAGYSGDGGLAVQASLNAPIGVAVDSSGYIYIVDNGNSRIRSVEPTGIINTVAGNGNAGYSGEEGPAPQASINQPYGVGVDNAGNIYIADTSNQRIRKVTIVLPGVSGKEIVIASQDGSERYDFDAFGRHLRTINTLTATTRYSFGYDTSGRLISITDGDGNITTVRRDISGKPTAIVAPGGQQTALDLDANGFLADIADPAGNATRLSYTSDGLLTSMRDPGGNIHSFTYNNFGLLIKDRDPAGGSTTLSRIDITDGYKTGFTVALSSALNRTNTYTVEYLSTGAIRKVNTYAGRGQRIATIGTDGSSTVIAPDGTVTTTTQGPDSRFGMQSPVTTAMTIRTPGGLEYNLTKTRTAALSDPQNLLSLATLTDTSSINGKTSASIYDASSGTMTYSSPMGRQSVSTLNSQGRVVSSWISGLLPVNYAYDSQGRLNTITQGTGPIARLHSYSYDAQNRISNITDPLSRSTGFAYDLSDRILQETMPDGRAISYGYDAEGNEISIIPPGRPAHSFDYTPVNLLQSYIPPGVGTGNYQTTYTYNPDRQLTVVSRPDGSLPGGAGQNQSVSFTYDGALLTGSAWMGDITGSVGFAYNNDFRRASESINGENAIEYTYDDDGLLIGAGALAINRDAGNGLVTGSTLGSVSDNWIYNGFGEPETYSASYNSSPLISIQYSRDNIGRITQKTETISGVTNIYGYSYDQAGRLTDVTKNGSNTAHYVYDDNGNRLGYTNANGTTISGAYDDQDRLIQYGANSYIYTANGELQSKTDSGGSTSYTYDAFGNLISVVLPNGTEVDYVIDGRNRRVGKRVNGILVKGFLYENELRPVAELDGNGNIVSRFVYGMKTNVPDYMIKNGNTFRIISDYLGSPRMVVDVSTGQIIQQMAYDEFGNVIQDTNPSFQPFGYAGGLYEKDTGLVRFGARDYDAVTGKWTAKDPIRFNGGDTNLFGYVKNNPVNFVDPKGLLTGKDTGDLCIEKLKQRKNTGSCPTEEDCTICCADLTDYDTPIFLVCESLCIVWLKSR
ncbi:MAG: PKD domain-containing protein [Thermodesulfovibrionales bacterium]|jgi:RHS repeat-associated protein